MPPQDFFFTFMAIGMAISRIFSGKIVDRGKITQVISAGLYLVVFSFFLLSACVYLISWNNMVCTIVFFSVALFLGVGFGIMFPAYNTLFVNLAPNSQRGTATSTLPDLLGCRHRYRYVDRRLYCRSQHL